MSMTQLNGQNCEQVFNRFNQLEFSFDQEEGTVTISGLDPCSYTRDEIAILECRENCDSNNQQCFEDCKTNFSGITNFAECVENCRDRVRNCEFECGPAPEPSRVAVSYTSAIQLWVTTNLFETFGGSPSVVIINDTTNGIPPFQISSKIIDELPEDTDNKGYSYCFFTEVLIEYDDGTCCYFRDSGWINKG